MFIAIFTFRIKLPTTFVSKALFQIQRFLKYSALLAIFHVSRNMGAHHGRFNRRCQNLPLGMWITKICWYLVFHKIYRSIQTQHSVQHIKGASESVDKVNPICGPIPLFLLTCIFSLVFLVLSSMPFTIIAEKNKQTTSCFMALQKETERNFLFRGSLGCAERFCTKKIRLRKILCVLHQWSFALYRGQDSTWLIFFFRGPWKVSFSISSNFQICFLKCRGPKLTGLFFAQTLVNFN